MNEDIYIGLDQVPNQFYADIAANVDQRQEWKKHGFEITLIIDANIYDELIKNNSTYFFDGFRIESLKEIESELDNEDFKNKEPEKSKRVLMQHNEIVENIDTLFAFAGDDKNTAGFGDLNDHNVGGRFSSVEEHKIWNKYSPKLGETDARIIANAKLKQPAIVVTNDKDLQKALDMEKVLYMKFKSLEDFSNKLNVALVGILKSKSTLEINLQFFNGEFQANLMTLIKSDKV